MPKNPRVHELARELGLTNEETLALCDALGIAVRDHSSSVHAAQADRVRRKADREGFVRDSQPGQEKTPRPQYRKTELSANRPPPLRVGLFCSGQCPEVIALLELLDTPTLHGTRFNDPDAATLRDYYPLVLEAFETTRTAGSRTNESLCTQLKALQTSFRKLRLAYRNNSRSKKVAISYKGKTADAYLLAYTPGNIAQAMRALQLGLTGASDQLVTRLASPNLDLEFHLFDQQDQNWTATRDALLNRGCNDQWIGRVEIVSNRFDITDPQQIRRHQSTIEQLDLVMFQNFDNEIEKANQTAAEESITAIATKVKSGSLLILSDLWHAWSSQRRLQARWNHLGLGDVQHVSWSGQIHPKPQHGSILTTCFFPYDERPRTQLKTNFLVLQRA